MRKWTCGHAVFHEGLPLVYDLNHLRVEGECASDARQIAAAADELMAHLDHRKVVVERDDIGGRLAADFDGMGWGTQRHVVMVHRRAPDRRVDVTEVVAVEDGVVWPARERYLRTYEWCNDDETAAQLHAAYRIWMRAGNGVDLAILRDGEPVSFALVWNDGDVAQIEDVATLPEHRDQGLSRAVVTHAIDVAYSTGADLVFLVADADDWPREFYAKLGFDELAGMHHFLKTNS